MQKLGIYFSRAGLTIAQIAVLMYYCNASSVSNSPNVIVPTNKESNVIIPSIDSTSSQNVVVSKTTETEKLNTQAQASPIVTVTKAADLNIIKVGGVTENVNSVSIVPNNSTLPVIVPHSKNSEIVHENKSNISVDIPKVENKMETVSLKDQKNNTEILNDNIIVSNNAPSVLTVKQVDQGPQVVVLQQSSQETAAPKEVVSLAPPTPLIQVEDLNTAKIQDIKQAIDTVAVNGVAAPTSISEVKSVSLNDNDNVPKVAEKVVVDHTAKYPSNIVKQPVVSDALPSNAPVILTTATGEQYLIPGSANKVQNTVALANNSSSTVSPVVSAVPDSVFERKAPSTQSLAQNWVDPSLLPKGNQVLKYNVQGFQNEANQQGIYYPSPAVAHSPNPSNPQGQEVSSKINSSKVDITVGTGRSTAQSQYALTLAEEMALQERVKLEAVKIESTLLALEKEQLQDRLAIQLKAQLQAQRDASMKRQSELQQIKEQVLKSLQQQINEDNKRQSVKSNSDHEVHRKHSRKSNLDLSDNEYDFNFSKLSDVKSAQRECLGSSRSECDDKDAFCDWRKIKKDNKTKHACVFQCSRISKKMCSKISGCKSTSKGCRNK